MNGNDQTEWFDDYAEGADELQVDEYDITATPNDFNVMTLYSFDSVMDMLPYRAARHGHFLPLLPWFVGFDGGVVLDPMMGSGTQSQGLIRRKGKMWSCQPK